MTHILNSELVVSSHGKELKNPFRALLVKGKNGATIKLQECANGEWYFNGGSWYLRTLLNQKIDDSLVIDHGHMFIVDSGMKAAIDQALKIILGEYKS